MYICMYVYIYMYLFHANVMTLGDVIGFHVFIRFSYLLYSLCHIRSLTFKFLNYTMGNKYSNPLDTRNYRLSVPREINVVSHSLNLVIPLNSSRSSQCSMTGITKVVVCAILSVGWCI